MAIPKRQPERRRPPEILRARDGGVPYFFVARGQDLEEAMAAIPDRFFLEAYTYLWHGDPPKRSADEIRRQALEIHLRRRDADFLPRSERRRQMRKRTRWQLVPHRMRPDPRVLEW